MMIQINTYIVVMVLDSIRVQNFHYLTVAWVKMSLFLELMWAHLCIFIIKKIFDSLIKHTCSWLDKPIVLWTLNRQMKISLRIKKIDILILDIDLTKGIGNTTLTAETKYWINFSWPNKKYCLNLHYYRSNSFLFVNAAKRYWLKVKDSEIKNISWVYKIYQEILQLITWKKQQY